MKRRRSTRVTNNEESETAAEQLLSQGLAQACGSLVTHLQDAAFESTRDIAACSETTLDLLLKAARGVHAELVAGNDHAPVTIPTHTILFSLWTLADEHINAVPFYTVEKRWLRLYTDTSLLLGIRDGWYSHLRSNTAEGRAEWFRAISTLDMALIVSGGIGETRLTWIQEVIRLLQVVQPRTIGESPSAKRFQLEHHDEVASRIGIAALEIEARPLTGSAKIRIGTVPFVVRSYFNSDQSDVPIWPAVEKWRSADYLLERVGEGRVVPVEVGQSYTDESWGQTIVPFREFLSRAGYDITAQSDASFGRDGGPLYLAQHTLFHQMPQLERDIALPDLIWSTPPSAEFPAYSPPDTPDNLLVNAWVGGGGGEVITPAHTDPYFNCYAQVTGRKRVWLAPPSCTRHMYAYGEGNVDKSDAESDITHQYMHNTSSVPVFGIPDTSDLRISYPNYFEHVWPVAQETLLGPGDMLFMPPGWWHAMRGEGKDPIWSVSIWF